MSLRAPIAACAVALALPLAADAFATGFCPCLTDLNNDGVTEGADLAILLGAWGRTQGGTEVGDFNEDGGVNGADLAILLGAWGPCPPPANDECPTGEVLEGADLYIDFCTAAATTSAFPSLSDCDGATVPIAKDIWFKYTVPYDGKLRVNTCSTVDFDSVLAVYGTIIPGSCACPGGLFTTLRACNDDACETDAFVELDMVADECLSIRLGGYGFANPEEGQGTLGIRAIKVGDRCDIAHELPSVLNQTVPGTTQGDTWQEADPSTCASNDTIDEWYRFVMPCQGSVTITTCEPGTDFDTTLSVFTSCGGAQIACNDDSPDSGCQIGGFNRKSKVSINAAGGEVLYIRVSGFEGDFGAFELTIDVDCIS